MPDAAVCSWVADVADVAAALTEAACIAVPELCPVVLDDDGVAVEASAADCKAASAACAALSGDAVSPASAGGAVFCAVPPLAGDRASNWVGSVAGTTGEEEVSPTASVAAAPDAEEVVCPDDADAAVETTGGGACIGMATIALLESSRVDVSFPVCDLLSLFVVSVVSPSSTVAPLLPVLDDCVVVDAWEFAVVAAVVWLSLSVLSDEPCWRVVCDERAAVRLAASAACCCRIVVLAALVVAAAAEEEEEAVALVKLPPVVCLDELVLFACGELAVVLEVVTLLLEAASAEAKAPPDELTVRLAARIALFAD